MDMNAMLQQAQKLQEDMENAQKRLETEEVEVSAAGGAIKIKITGLTEFRDLKISDELFKEGNQAVSEAILSAINEAVKQSKSKHEEAMKSITSSLDLPGMGDLGDLGSLGGPSSGGPTGRAKDSTGGGFQV